MIILYLTIIISLSIWAIIFLYVGIPFIYSRWARLLLKRKAIRCRTLVLTFDDGPSSTLTPAILDILLEYGVKASFFLLGKNVIDREHIVQRITAEGHDICSHGYEHLCYWNVSPLRSIRDIERGWKAIDSALGTERHKYPFRPPFGKLNICSLLYLLIKRVPIHYWSIVSGDTWPTENRNPERIAEEAREDSSGIVLLHDFPRSKPSTDVFVLKAVRFTLETAQHNNMQVMSITELLDNVDKSM